MGMTNDFQEEPCLYYNPHKIESYCRKKFSSVKELAETSGIQDSTIRNLMKGRIKNPQIGTFVKLADAFHVTLNDLVLADRPNLKVKEVVDTMDEEQKKVMYYLISQARRDALDTVETWCRYYS